MLHPVLKQLKPFDIDLGKLRLGPAHDGGYTVVDFELQNVNSILAYGVGDTLEFENDFARRYSQCKIFAYDHTIEHVPQMEDNVQFVAEGVSAHRQPRLDTIDAHLAANELGDDNLILKMDVEGAEWAVFDAISESTIRKFQQIIVEFHHSAKGDFSVYARVYEKLNKYFRLVHVHANNALGLLESDEYGGLALPILLENTYLRNDLVDHTYSPGESFPTKLDRPNFPDRPDHKLDFYPFTWRENRLHLILKYYRDTNPERQRELDYCLKRNLENSSIEGVHLLLENEDDRPQMEDPKLHVTCINKWLTYEAAFRYANDALAHTTVCVANSDVFFDESLDLDLVNHLLSRNVALCLSRHEFNGATSAKDDQFARLCMANTQDAWILKTPVRDIEQYDFCVGILGCDNAIADRLSKAGYLPVNMGSRFVVHHFDVARGKTGSNYIGYHKRYPIEQTYPEEEGQYLVPDYDMIKLEGLDALAKKLGLSPLERYRAMCSMMMQKVRVRNR